MLSHLLLQQRCIASTWELGVFELGVFELGVFELGVIRILRRRRICGLQQDSIVSSRLYTVSV
jgi:hypothetical protein